MLQGCRLTLSPEVLHNQMPISVLHCSVIQSCPCIALLQAGTPKPRHLALNKSAYHLGGSCFVAVDNSAAGSSGTYQQLLVAVAPACNHAGVVAAAEDVSRSSSPSKQLGTAVSDR